MKQIMDDEAIVRGMICHENEMTNHRLGWLNTIEGFLFAALSLAWDKGKGPQDEDLVVMLALIGIYVALVSYVGLRFSHKAVARLYQWHMRTRNPDGPGVVGFWSESGCFGPWNVLPSGFIMAWGGVIYVTHRSLPALIVALLLAAIVFLLVPMQRRVEGIKARVKAVLSVHRNGSRERGRVGTHSLRGCLSEPGPGPGDALPSQSRSIVVEATTIVEIDCAQIVAIADNVELVVPAVHGRCAPAGGHSSVPTEAGPPSGRDTPSKVEELVLG